MKALSTLRVSLGLKKDEELGKKFSPENLKRILEAMKEYAASKCNEQRKICQFEFESSYESESINLNSNASITEMYDCKSLMESEKPEFD